jgi:hypothetical protein
MKLKKLDDRIILSGSMSDMLDKVVYMGRYSSLLGPLLSKTAEEIVRQNKPDWMELFGAVRLETTGDITVTFFPDEETLFQDEEKENVREYA